MVCSGDDFDEDPIRCTYAAILGAKQNIFVLSPNARAFVLSNLFNFRKKTTENSFQL